MNRFRADRIYHRLFITRIDALQKYGNLYGETVCGYEIDEQNSINIDTIEDWNLAEKVLEKRNVEGLSEQ
jgi:CMP-N-acetylneuraminic acid synthetase